MAQLSLLHKLSIAVSNLRYLRYLLNESDTRMTKPTKRCAIKRETYRQEVTCFVRQRMSDNSRWRSCCHSNATAAERRFLRSWVTSPHPPGTDLCSRRIYNSLSTYVTSFQWVKRWLWFDWRSTVVRLTFDCATTIRRPTSRPGCCTAA